MRAALLTISLIASFTANLLAQENVPLPPYVTFPSETILPPSDDTQSLRDTYDEVELPKPAGIQRGEYWHANIIYPLKSLGVPEPTGVDIFAKLSPALKAGGWTIPYSDPQRNPFDALLHYQKGNREAWLYMSIFSYNDIRVDLISPGAQPMKFALNPPAKVAPVINPDEGDFPDLPPLPGSTFKGGSPDGGMMRITVPSVKGDAQDIVVARNSIDKTYSKPDLSNLQFITVYRAALQAAGWTVIDFTPGISHTDSILTAHYGKNGRNIWTYMHHSGDDYDIRVGEDAADSLAREFGQSCHVALYGVLFDFDKATLRPESDGILTKAVDIIRSAKGAQIEIQGHTDSVGADAYNQKLSEARAASVMAWFAAHQIPAAQMTSKGYGKTKPVADNSLDEGRAKNRRVEISRPDCAK